MEYFGFDFGQFEMAPGLHPNAPILEEKQRKIQEREENFVLMPRVLEPLRASRTARELTQARRKHLQEGSIYRCEERTRAHIEREDS